MRLFIYLSVLIYLVALITTSRAFEDHAATFVREQCTSFMQSHTLPHLNAPKFSHMSDLVLTKYKRMPELELTNQGGHHLIHCDGFNLPAGLHVRLTRDGHSCRIFGVPMQAQASTHAYIVAANQRGRALAVVPIAVNALVLQE